MKKEFPVPLPFVITISEEKKKDGTPRCSKNCPTAQAIQALVGHAYHVRTHTQYTHIYDRDEDQTLISTAQATPLWLIKHPFQLVEWIKTYDSSSSNPDPIEITIEASMISG